MDFNRVSPGQRLAIRAATFNAALGMAEGHGKPTAPSFPPRGGVAPPVFADPFRPIVVGVNETEIRLRFEGGLVNGYVARGSTVDTDLGGLALEDTLFVVSETTYFYLGVAPAAPTAEVPQGRIVGTWPPEDISVVGPTGGSAVLVCAVLVAAPIPPGPEDPPNPLRYAIHRNARTSLDLLWHDLFEGQLREYQHRIIARQA
jgi:hypothetical protein